LKEGFVKRIFWLLLLMLAAQVRLCAQGDVIHYDSGYTWRGYTGSTAPVCQSKLCHAYPIYAFDSYYRELASWKSVSGDVNTARIFLNYRILFPPGYNFNDQTTKWPVVIMMHGAGESGRVWTDHFSYEPTDPRYDNNSHTLRYSGNEHRMAAAKPASDPGSCRAIVVFPQVSYSASWSDLTKQDLSELELMFIDFIQNRLVGRYHADPNRVVMHGISAGAREMWALATKRPDLFAAIIPMSAVPVDHEAAANALLTMPIWIFQGGLDNNPSPSASQALMAEFAERGGTPRYTVYPDWDHDVWMKAYKEPDFFSWIMARDQRKLYVRGNITELCSEPIRLGGPGGMSGYQWSKDGVDISGQTGRYFTATTAGSYAAKFKRPNGQWEQSSPVQITAKAGCVVTETDPFPTEAKAYPNPTSDVVHVITDGPTEPSSVRVLSTQGQIISVPVEVEGESGLTVDLRALTPGMYIIRIADGRRYKIIKQ
jgi:predicted esterase